MSAKGLIMSTTESELLFLGSFLLTVTASAVLSRRIEQLGKWLRLSESLLGIVAAPGADAPEISSSISALRSGNHDLGLGIVLGSNIFNLAALLGLSALISGKVRVGSRTLLLNGGVALGVMALTAAQLFGVLPNFWAIGLIAAIMVPYIAATALSPTTICTAAAFLGLNEILGLTISDANRDAKLAERPRRPSYADILDVLPALLCIVLGSIGLVRSAIVLGAAWKVSTPILGTIILASLTGIPNVVTAVQLARRGRGSAVLSESLNSNTLNLIVGVSVPALFFGSASLSARSVLALWWLVGMTILALGLSWVRGGLGRKSGALLVAIYGAFVLAMILS
jgi:cation:H+ antiporter